MTTVSSGGGRSSEVQMSCEQQFAIDDFRCWTDGASIQIKAVTSHGDPVDLGTDEVRAIVEALIRMIEHIDGPG